MWSQKDRTLSYRNSDLVATLLTGKHYMTRILEICTLVRLSSNTQLPVGWWSWALKHVFWPDFIQTHFRFSEQEKPPPFIQGWAPLVILLLLIPPGLNSQDMWSNWNVKCDGEKVRNQKCEQCELLEHVVEGVEEGRGVGFWGRGWLGVWGRCRRCRGSHSCHCWWWQGWSEAC